MKKSLLCVVIFFQMILLSLGVTVFSLPTVQPQMSSQQIQVAQTTALTDLTAPRDLTELQDATDEQLDAWTHLSKFDGRDYGYITKTKSQGSMNLCWAFAAVGAAEASILREGIDPDATKENLDLDEVSAAFLCFNRDGKNDTLLLTTNDTYSSDVWNRGSHANQAFFAMTEGHFPISEQGFNQETSAETIQSALDASEAKYFVQNYVRVANDRDAIKRAILKYGAVTMEYQSDGWQSHLYIEDGKSYSHASILVGWNDDISSTLFSPDEPSENGAWIVKNSWGDYGNRNNGTTCYYLSYQSNLRSDALFAVDLGLKKEYQNIYHYDGQMATSLRNYLVDAYGAIYEAKLTNATQQEQLKAVVIALNSSNSTVNVKVYRHLTVNPGNVNDEINIPDQNTPVADKTVYFARDGLYTIDLDTPIDLEQGEYFSIVVSGTQSYGQPISLVCAVDGITSLNDMTYRLYNGEWTSFKNSNYYADTSTDCMAVRIRAITNTVPREVALGNDLAYARVEIPNRLVFYEQGKALKPQLTVLFGDTVLKENLDYTVVFRDNMVPGQSTIEIRGMKNYYGTRTTSFEVAKPKYPPGRISGTINVYNNVKKLHDIEIPQNWEWIDLDSVLEMGKSSHQYSLKYVGSDAEFYQITTCDFYVNKLDQDPPGKIDLSTAEVVVLGDCVYTGSELIPTVRVTLSGNELSLGVDFQVSCENNINAGTEAVVIVSGYGRYEGQVRQLFEIKKAKHPLTMPNDTIMVSRKAKSLQDVTLDCEGWRWSNPSQQIDGNQTTVTAIYDGVDKDNFEELEMQITIVVQAQKDIAKITEIKLEQNSFVFDNTSKMPHVFAKDGNIILKENEDFRVTYRDNLNAGQATVDVQGQGDYNGTTSLTFTITRAERKNFVVSQPNWTFGDDVTPDAILSGQEEEAEKTIEYSKDKNGVFTSEKPTNAGTYWVKVTIAASTNYLSAEGKASFKILPKDLAGCSIVVEDENLSYTGQAVQPKICVKVGQTVLKSGTDFAVAFENNVNAGKNAKVKISGLGNYSGTSETTFEIKKAVVANFSTTIHLKRKFETLSEIKLPDGFAWDESSVIVVTERQMIATAIYTGENYAFSELQFEIIIDQTTENGTQIVWIWAGIAAAIIVLAVTVTVICVAQSKRKHKKHLMTK